MQKEDLQSVPSPFVKTYDFIFFNKAKNRTEVNLSSKLQKVCLLHIVTVCFLFVQFQNEQERTHFAVHYEKIRIHSRETVTDSAEIHSLTRKNEHLRINQI